MRNHVVKSTLYKTEGLQWCVLFGVVFFFFQTNVKCFTGLCNFFFLLHFLETFTLVRESKASQWCLPEHLSQPPAAGTEEAMLEAIMLLPAVAWVSWWLLTEDPGSQTVITAPYAIDQALLKHLLHRRQWKITLLSLANQTVIWGPSHLYLFWEGALSLFSMLLFQVADLQLLQTLQNEGELFEPPSSPLYVYIHYGFLFCFKLIHCASWLIHFVNKKEMILRYPNVLQIITVDSFCV